MIAQFSFPQSKKRPVTLTLEPEEAISLLAYLNWCGSSGVRERMEDLPPYASDEMWETLGTLLANDPAYADDVYVRAHADSLRAR